MGKKFGIIILAAGSSVRMGRPKQSLLLHNETLLERITRTASSLHSGSVIIISGADTDIMNSDAENIIKVYNDKRQEGIASSIRCGVETLIKKFPFIEGTIISVCDQPYVTTELLQQMIDKHYQSNLPVIACSYGSTIGTPVLFHHSLFPELLQLKGDKGAKAIVQKDKERVGLVNFPLGNVDIDTVEDYILLQKTEKK